MSSIPKTVQTLPIDIEAEKRVLGILIKYPQEIDYIIERLRPSILLSYHKIYQVILYTLKRGGFPILRSTVNCEKAKPLPILRRY